METLQLMATTTAGLEAVVKRELQDMGFTDARTVSPGRVGFATDAAGLVRANLWLRTAERVLLVVGSFPAEDFDALYDGTMALDWAAWIPADGEFPVRGRSYKSQLSSAPACQKTVKKAIVESLRTAHGVDELPETGPLFTVEVALRENVATLTMDTSGPGLHKRGYRAAAGPAPLKETLAAAMIQLSFWKPDRPLIDPFCGSGTIPIEAAMIGRNIAPGLNRSFVAETWEAIPASVWGEARREAREQILPDLPVRIIGMDIEPKAVSLAMHHAEQAGVAADIHFQQKAFEELSSSREYGCLIFNPPYGRRFEGGPEVDAIYRAMPDVFRRLKTWSFYVITPVDIEKVLGQPADRRRKLYNGQIECTYYQFYGPRPPKEGDVANSPAAAFGGLGETAEKQAEMFANRLKKNARHLRRWPSKGVACYRIYDRDIPEVPLAVDIYEGRLHIAEYDRPHERTPAQHADWLDRMAKAAGEAMDIPRNEVFFKRRERQKGSQQYSKFDQQQRICTVQENNLTFEVNLSDYLDTGLFLDHRITRKKVMEESAGKRFLNLFAYTGAFSVYAAAGGAASTTTVDLSNTYIDWAQRNMAANGFSGKQHRFYQGDVMDFLRQHEPGEHFDLAVIDPPTFSNSKSLDDVFDIQRDYEELLLLTARLMPSNGVIYFSTNFRKFKFEPESLPGLTAHEISRQTVPEDFRNKRIHRCWRLLKE